MKKKIIRITTVPISLEKLLEGQLRFMKGFYHVIAVSSDKKRLESFGQDQEVDVFYVELTRKITPIKDLKALLKLYRFLKKEKPHIVHSHTPKAGIIGMLASYLVKVPIRLHTVAGLPLLEETGIKRSVLNLVERLTYKCATKVYPNSNGLKKIILVNRFAKEEKVKVISKGSSNGINTSYFNPKLFSKEDKTTLKKNLDVEENNFIFIFVGRLVGDKGINELVNAFNKLSMENKSVGLLLVGPFEDELDPLKEGTKKIINKNNQIISVGFQKDVRPYFSIANVLVFPSYREGFPNVVMQAGAMELPSIVTDINGCNEIIVNGENGWIIPVKNEDAILDAMKNCILDKNEFAQVKLNSRKMIVDRFEQQTVWEALLKEYKSLEKNV